MAEARATLRAEQLLKAWGKSKAIEVAGRNLAEAKRTGSREHQAFCAAVCDELRRLTGAPAPV
ncbi:MAG TPA: hypothetical protein VED40_09515 [Azospirillaceae bacterium]|nr:hypothetical protein [Azospirillaceae bacterium]